MKGGDSVGNKNYLLKLPAGLHRETKMQAASEGVTFNELVIKAIELYLKKKGGQ